jgi:hypothetical protein
MQALLLLQGNTKVKIYAASRILRGTGKNLGVLTEISPLWFAGA